MGLRWDLFTRPVEKFHPQSKFDPTTGLIDVASPNNRGPNVDNNHGNWGPRFALAYSPDAGKTAIRAAFGIRCLPDNFGATGGTLERNYPFFTLGRYTTPTLFTPFWSLSGNGLTAPINVPYTPGGTLVPRPGFGVFFVAKGFKQDQAQVCNFSIDRQLPPQNFVLSYNYELPFGRGETFLSGSSGFVGYLVSGGSINGISTFQAGQPLWITVANNLLDKNGGSNSANITCTNVATPKLVGRWFDTGCFAAAGIHFRQQRRRPCAGSGNQQ
jgi:hypothetical protein